MWELVRDTQHEIAQAFLDDKTRDPRDQLFDELRPLFCAIRRRVEKSSDGVETLKKTVTVSIEDYDQITDTLKAECDTHFATLQRCLGQVSDPCDTFKTELLEKYRDKAVLDIQKLVLHFVDLIMVISGGSAMVRS